MRSNCLVVAWRVYRELARHDKPGEPRTWVCFARSWAPGVPFHAGVMRPVPGGEHYELIHFQPATSKRRWWWPEWAYRGFMKRGDWPKTELPEGGRW